MPRLFISYSSKDTAQALVFQRWLMANGWPRNDVFIDRNSIDAGERWRDALCKANALCEALIFLASPDSVESKECFSEMILAVSQGKEIIVAILRDLQRDDPRLALWADRQFVDLSAEPRETMEPFEHAGRLQQVDFHMPALNAISARLAHLGISPGSFVWTPQRSDNGPLKGPYPGLDAFGEDDAGIFFGREADIMAGMTRLRTMRMGRTPRLLIIQAASGAGKSSFLRAGLWPRLKLDPDFAPLAIVRPALGIVTGPEGLGRGMAPFFARHRQPRTAGDINAGLKPRAEAAVALASLFSDATALAANVRRTGAADAQPPAAIVAIDQGEELFAPENIAESEHFLELLAAVLRMPPVDVDPYVIVTIRVDSVDHLLQRWPALGLEAPATQVLTPLAPSAYRDVIVKPAQVFSEQARKLDVEPALVEQLVRDAQGADALPLLAFTLEKLFSDFGDGNLTLARYEGMGGVGGSIDRALILAQKEAGSTGTADNLKLLMVPGLATWDTAANAAKRLPAMKAELLSGDRAQLAPLADALVANRLLTRGAGTLEVAHEALLRRPQIAGWLVAQKDALKLRDDVLREAEEWGVGGKHHEGLVRRGARLESALALQADPEYGNALGPAKEYLSASRELETAGQRRTRRVLAVAFASLLAVIAASQYVIFREPINAFVYWNTAVRWYIGEQIAPYVLTVERERAMRPGDPPFRECKEKCPEIVVIPAGIFVMGSPDGKTPVIGLDGKPKSDAPAPAENDRNDDEGPQHEVAIAAFAAGKFEVTFDDYDECVRLKGCAAVSDVGWGRGRQPAINVSWDEAKAYVTWLARITRQPYRLLSEAEWEYAARAGSTTVWSFGNDEREICKYANLADLSLKKMPAPAYAEIDFCDDGHSVPAPVGSYRANAFGLYDMHGNVFEWTEDCYVANYDGAPKDGSARHSDGCKFRVARGGSFDNIPQYLRAAFRLRYSADNRVSSLGFRIGRSLLPPRTQ